MSTGTKKEQIHKLFEMTGIKEVIKKQQEMIVIMSVSSVEKDMAQEIIEEFTEKTLEIMKSQFEQIIDKRFTKVEVEELIAMYSNPLYKRLEEIQEVLKEQVVPKIDELVEEMQTKLTFLIFNLEDDTLKE